MNCNHEIIHYVGHQEGFGKAQSFDCYNCLYCKTTLSSISLDIDNNYKIVSNIKFGQKQIYRLINEWYISHGGRR